MQFPNLTNTSLSESLQHVLEESDVQALVDARDYNEYDELDEISLYASLDPILADLLKQYKNADKQSLFLDKEFADDDPMAEIAQDRKDSAWSMVQTRLLELREDEKFAGQVGLRLMRLEEERAGLIPRLKEKKMQEDFLVREREDKRRAQRDHDDHETDLLMFFLWMWLTKQWAEKSRKKELNLQNNFILAA